MTFEFKDLMGVTVVAEPLLGADLEELTSAQASKSIGDRVITILSRRIKKLGTLTKVTEDLLRTRIPLQNLNYIIFQLRNHSYGEPENFHFTFPYKSVLPENKGAEKVIELTEPLKERNHIPYSQQVEEVEDFKLEQTIEVNGVEYKWQLPTQASTQAIGRLKRKDLNSVNLLFTPRNVRKKIVNDGTEHWIVVNPSTMYLPEISKLTKEFEREKAFCDTRIEFEHPEAEFVEPSDAYIVLNMLEMNDFFLDSSSQ